MSDTERTEDETSKCKPTKGGGDPSNSTVVLRQCFVTAAICLNTLGHACGIGYAAVLLPQLQAPDSDIPLTHEAESWIASVPSFALLVGNFLVPPVMSRFGRKGAMYTCTLPALVGCAVTVLARNVVALIVGRILVGLSFGMILPLRSVMLGEYTSPTKRGAFLATIAFSQGFGIFCVHLLGSVMSWQNTALVTSSFFAVSATMIAFAPESPSFLASKGRYDQCRKSFRWLRGAEEEDELETMIEACILLEKHKIERKSSPKTNGLRDLMVVIRKPEFYKPIILMSHAYFMSQYSGGSIMANYPTEVITRLMGPSVSASFWMVFLDAQRIITSACSIYLHNKTKRRTMMLGSISLCACAHLGMAAYVYLRNSDKLSYDALWIPILLINLQVFSVGVGTVPVPSIIAGEVYAMEYRAISGSIASISLAVSMFICLKTFPLLLARIGLEGTYAVFSGILFYNLVVISVLLPETKDRTLQDIEDEFRGRPLKPEEVEERKSLQADPVMILRRMSERRRSSMILP